jgi:hypothetical protein
MLAVLDYSTGKVIVYANVDFETNEEAEYYLTDLGYKLSEITFMSNCTDVQIFSEEKES